MSKVIDYYVVNNKKYSPAELSENIKKNKAQYADPNSYYVMNNKKYNVFSGKEIGDVEVKPPKKPEQPKQPQTQPMPNTSINKLIESLTKQINSQPSYEDIYNKVMANMPKPKEIPTLSSAEAQMRAKNTLGGLYDDKNKKMLEEMDKDALRRGFFGQLPTEALRQNTAASLESQKRSEIANLASKLQGESHNQAMQQQNLALQQNQQALNTTIGAINAANSASSNSTKNMTNLLNILTDQERYKDTRSDIDFEKAFKERAYVDSRGDVNWEKLFKERQYIDSRGDVDWQRAFKEMAFQSDNAYKILQLLKDERFYNDKRGDIEWEKLFKEATQQFNNRLAEKDQKFKHEVTEAQLTGYWKGEPTMAMQKLLFDMGMDEEKAKLQQKQINSSISQSWSRIAIQNKTLKHRIEQDAREAARMEKNYNKSVNETVFNLTLKGLMSSDKYKNDEGDFDFGRVPSADFQRAFDRNLDIVISQTESKIKDDPTFDGLLR